MSNELFKPQKLAEEGSFPETKIRKRREQFSRVRDAIARKTEVDESTVDFSNDAIWSELSIQCYKFVRYSPPNMTFEKFKAFLDFDGLFDEATEALATCLEMPLPLRESFLTVLPLLEKHSRDDEAWAHYSMGLIFEHRPIAEAVGLEWDLVRASQYYCRARDLDFPLASTRIGWMYAAGTFYETVEE